MILNDEVANCHEGVGVNGGSKQEGLSGRMGKYEVPVRIDKVAALYVSKIPPTKSKFKDSKDSKDLNPSLSGKDHRWHFSGAG